jgi:hypothetical protein
MRTRNRSVYLALLFVTGCFLAPAAYSEPFNRPGNELTKQILQRKDKTLRQQALDRAKTMLASETAAEKKDALEALATAHDVPFDRKPFTPLVRQCLTDKDADVRAAALWTIAAAGGDASDYPAIAKLADDRSPLVRQRVTGALVSVGKNQPPPAGVLAPVVQKFLNDEDKSVRKEALRATWGVPVSEAAEKRMIELSRTADSADDAVYFGLSTRPKKSKAVCERLVEVMRGEGGEANDKGRAAWGLTYGVSGEASDLVAKAMIEEVDETLDDYVREQCIRALGGFGSEDALKKLRDVAEHDESERARSAAKQALRGR